MNSSAKKVLVISEGKSEAQLLKRLFEKFELPGSEVVRLNANLCKLYKEYESYGCDYSDLDVTAVLRSSKQVSHADKEKLRGKSADDFSDIFLVFDLDPHTGDFNPDSVQKLMSHFRDSSDFGKLYINYPMVESFYHVPPEVLEKGNIYGQPIHFVVRDLTGYKERVSQEGFRYSTGHTQENYRCVICRHAQIVKQLTEVPFECTFKLKAQLDLLKVQLSEIQKNKAGTVVNTFCLLLPDLYPSKCPLTE
ncbi:hypothetical protein [Turicimonas muris]|uniref:hypothetical protein n=1 Tax=Turicimonas muris TaxID=1796652 RepID=UPI0026DFD85F|nr:hypothetical protein [Turicimonas muris]